MPTDYPVPPPPLFAQSARFDGATFNQDLDGERLSGQLQRVMDLMRDGKWRTLAEIAASVAGSEPAVSARLRDLRKPRFGGHTVDRERTESPGVWKYRLRCVQQEQRRSA